LFCKFLCKNVEKYWKVISEGPPPPPPSINNLTLENQSIETGSIWAQNVNIIMILNLHNTLMSRDVQFLGIILLQLVFQTSIQCHPSNWNYWKRIWSISYPNEKTILLQISSISSGLKSCNVFLNLQGVWLCVYLFSFIFLCM